MPEFVNPFSGMVHRQMTQSELSRAIMLNIAAELEAVHLYLAHMDATSNEEARKVLYDIAQEEMVHAGEFTSLLYRLDPIAGAKAEEGFTEVRELLGNIPPYQVTASAGAVSAEAADSSSPAGNTLTVGSLKGS